MTVQVTAINTLTYDPERCVGCGMCSVVCPHAVFEQDNGIAALVHPEDCIECGECMMNCPVDAISVDTGPGCAAALIRAALTGGEPTCGPSDGCCGGAEDGPAAQRGRQGHATEGCCGGGGQHEHGAEGCCGGARGESEKRPARAGKPRCC